MEDLCASIVQSNHLAVENWLSSINKQHYLDVFIHLGYDNPRVLQVLDQDDLDKMGITDVEDRIQILQASSDLNLNSRQNTQLALPPIQPNHSITTSPQLTPVHYNGNTNNSQALATTATQPKILTQAAALREKKKRRKDLRGYSPQRMSDPWAVLVGLYMANLPPINKASLLRSELCDQVVQVYKFFWDKDKNPGVRGPDFDTEDMTWRKGGIPYFINNLVDRDLVRETKLPYRYSLSEIGFQMAESFYELEVIIKTEVKQKNALRLTNGNDNAMQDINNNDRYLFDDSSMHTPLQMISNNSPSTTKTPPTLSPSLNTSILQTPATDIRHFNIISNNTTTSTTTTSSPPIFNTDNNNDNNNNNSATNNNNTSPSPHTHTNNNNNNNNNNNIDSIINNQQNTDTKANNTKEVLYVDSDDEISIISSKPPTRVLKPTPLLVLESQSYNSTPEKKFYYVPYPSTPAFSPIHFNKRRRSQEGGDESVDTL